MLTDPDLFGRIIELIISITVDYLEQQALAGAEALQIFDTWVSHLDWNAAQTYSSDAIATIIQRLRDRGVKLPITVFGKQTSVFYPLYATTGASVISFDWNANLANVDENLDTHIGIQGNLDPFVLYSSHDVIEKRVKGICNSIVSGRPFIFNLGHGLMPDIPIESVQCVIDTIRSA